ncbi:MAG: hypothetical protein EBU08_17150 [Micrococcales bacterium]|nr:hypothetical protein [Micrococcales bacterium]
MTYYSGKDGTLTYNGTAVAKVSSWSFSASVDTLETTVLTDSDRSYVPGLRQFSGSATIFYYEDVGSTAPAPKPLLEKIISTSAIGESGVTLRLGWSSSKYIQGSVIITSGELSCAVGEVMQATVQFQFTGPLNGVTL